jgi:tRNA nucleotidyltransferase (CCA-adding enzyme)
MEALYDCPQDAEWHPEGNVWIHTLMVIDKARELNGDCDRPRLATIMLGAICHDLGKPMTTAVIDGGSSRRITRRWAWSRRRRSSIA